MKPDLQKLRELAMKARPDWGQERPEGELFGTEAALIRATSPDVVLALLDEIERLTRGRDEMIDAVIEGPLNGRTSHDEILSLRTQLQAAIVERDKTRLDHISTLGQAGELEQQLQAARAECDSLKRQLKYTAELADKQIEVALLKAGPRKDGGE